MRRSRLAPSLVAVCLPWLCCAGLSAQQWRAARPPSLLAKMVFDVARSRTVLFGGHDNDNIPLADTWEHDGVHWTTQRTTTTPLSREGHALAYDMGRGRTVLFSGIAGSGTTNSAITNDTWEYDGLDWTRVFPTASPPMRTGHAMTYDATRARIVLFGGGNTAGLDDTWEYDGITWSRVWPTTSPSARSDHALTFDLSRGRTVLFGGTGGGLVLNDTWEYDGVNWAQRNTALSPSARIGFSLTYDVARARTVLFAGSSIAGGGLTILSDTWEYNGSNWQQMPNVGSPGLRTSHCMTYDWPRARSIVCGGTGGPSPGLTHLIHSDTWEYDGVLWQQNLTSTAPPPRTSHAIAYDAARQRTVLFGGSGYGAALGDTWEFDGQQWAAIQTMASPPPMYYHAMAYDAGRRLTVLFGGLFVGSTFEYDGMNWRPVAGASPPARLAHAMAYDAARARMVLFGGMTASSPWYVYLNDTWEFDGTHWTGGTTNSGPSPRGDHGLAFDVARGRTVLFGGYTPSAWFSDTWQFDGANWTQAQPATSPPAQTNVALAYDPVRGRTMMFGDTTWEFDGATWAQVVTAAAPTRRGAPRLVCDISRNRIVLFGGWAWNGALSAETWELQPAATPTWTRHGLGCPGSAGTPVLDCATAPGLGSTVTLQLTSLPSMPGAALLAFGHDIVQWNGSPLPVGLGAFGLPGCRMWIAPVPLASLLLAHPGNAASFSFWIPANPALAGVALGAQAMVLDAAAPSGIGAVSNAGILRVN